MPLDVKPCYFLDGSFYLNQLNGINVTNRAFKFGDFIFETIRTKANQALLLDWHRERLIRGMKVLNMNTEGFPSVEQLHKFIEQIINKHRYFVDCRIRLTVFRKGEGLYLPETDEVSVMIEVKPLTVKGYPVSDDLVIADVYRDNVKPKGSLSNFKTGLSIISVLASHLKQERKVDEVFLCNSENRIIEATSSNLFWVIENRFFTPMVSEGCVDGVMRRKIIELLNNKGYEVIETIGVTEATLLSADEIFLTNAIVGVKGVVGLHKKRYYRTQSKFVSSLLNEWYLAE